MQKPYFEWVKLSFSEIKERNSQKCKCGKKSVGVLKKPDNEPIVICGKCLLLDVLPVCTFVAWSHMVNKKLEMKFKRFDPNWHL